MFKFFRDFVMKFSSEREESVGNAINIPKETVEVKVGDEFEVNNPDEARAKLVRLCFDSRKMITGSANWDENTGKGRLRIESVENTK